MINFIVCEDNKIILQKNLEIINKMMFNNSIDYKIYPFTEYNNALQKLIRNKEKNKIYILDVELSNISGIDISREIREFDRESFILISTVHTEYLPYTLKSKLLIYDFISKFDDYENTLSNILKEIIDLFPDSHYLKVHYKGENIIIDYDDIIKIKYDKDKRKTIITTENKVYEVRVPLKSVTASLDSRFEKKDGIIINSSKIKK